MENDKTTNKQLIICHDSHDDVFLKDSFGDINLSIGYKVKECKWVDEGDGKIKKIIEEAELVAVYIVDSKTGKDIGQLNVDDLKKLPISIVNLHKLDKRSIKHELERQNKSY